MNPDLREFYRLAQEEAKYARLATLCRYIVGIICALTWMIWLIVRA